MTSTLRSRLIRNFAARRHRARRRDRRRWRRLSQPPQQQAAPQAPRRNPVCTRLEAQLAAFDRGGADQARAEQIRKYETAAAQQQAELDRQQAQARRAGCESNSFFSLFSGQPAAMRPAQRQIQQMRGNLDRIKADLARLQAATPRPSAKASAAP